MYDRFAGGRDRGRSRCCDRSLREPGNDDEREVVWVAELGGRVAGVMAAFPVADARPRSRRVPALGAASGAAVALAAGAVALLGGRPRPPSPPARALYVDALATDAAFGRRGVAPLCSRKPSDWRAPASWRRWRSTPRASNAGARALYARAGYGEVACSAGGARRCRASWRWSRSLARAERRSTLASGPPRRARPGPRSARGKNGSASERRATSSQTGNSPSRWPKRSR